ncbi:nuclear transport factor 2 family protein [Nocardioides panacisoli]|uniref:nuclear transport factor 2 family protein n=1 Tax=Nocardioides panacisoli TaxID=627624 RepID=UPI001C62D9F4|nr:nuclear transport factor 2 family protein [Nocardioides panacisoli]QYJ03606.1 nuclear transport factor 2 family protein [Nocardioides panacisoli]
MSAQDRAAELAARVDIADTVYAYSRGIDRCDFALLADLFTEDATFDYGHGNVTRGRDALGELFRGATGRYTATNHHCSTINYLRLDAGRAETITYVYAFHENSETDLQLHVWGNYEDVLVDEGDRWRIAERRVRIAGVRTTGGEPLPERFERYARG